MSWSFQYSGTPSEIVSELDKYSSALIDQSKAEFDDALPHLKGLVEQNFVGKDAANPPHIVLTASGYGAESNGEQLYRYCSVNLQRSA